MVPFRKSLVLLVCGAAVPVLGAFRPCDFVCTGGRCDYADCTEPSCPGGVCIFYDSTRPQCGGGSCIFVRCSSPTCDGGSCRFNDTRTTIRDGYCKGGACVVQGRRWPIKFTGGLSY